MLLDKKKPTGSLRSLGTCGVVSTFLLDYVVNPQDLVGIVGDIGFCVLVGVFLLLIILHDGGTHFRNGLFHSNHPPFLEVGSQSDGGGSLGFLCLDHLSLDNSADGSLSGGQVMLGNLSLCLIDIEVLELLQEPALDGGISHLLLNHVVELSLDLLGGNDADVVSHEGEGQTCVGLLLLDLLGGSDRSELEGGLNTTKLYCVTMNQLSLFIAHL